jgi:putative membrane protein|tara:strand:- start:419 stop:1345 length:927 start_codon:yes stop_codon:yes gene_type:complete
MKGRSILQYLMLSVRGVAMGAADVVPGVSGGTIAFITGIYEELIESLNNINLGAAKVLIKDGIKAFWKHINGTFFLFLFGGIIVSIALLANVVGYLLETQPVILWSFFFGLIIASVWLIGKSIKEWNAGVIVSLLIGTGVAFYISTIHTVAQGSESWYIVFSGAIAICAMILPGVSGSFILVLLGTYSVVLDAIKDRDFMIIGLFAIGCLIGLMSFARLLKFLFSKFKEITIALLTGFMIGSLYKVWPWKNAFGEAIVTHSDGKKDFMMANVLPDHFTGDAQPGLAIASAVVGLAVIVILDRFAPKES